MTFLDARYRFNNYSVFNHIDDKIGETLEYEIEDHMLFNLWYHISMILQIEDKLVE